MVLTRASIACVLMFTVATDAVAADANRAQSASKLVNLVRAIEHDDSIVHADFAAIALEAMTNAYERELEKVASPRRRFSSRERKKQWRWAAAARKEPSRRSEFSSKGTPKARAS